MSAQSKDENENSLGQVPKPFKPKRIYSQSLLQLTETPLKLVNLSSVKPPSFVSQNINSCAMHLCISFFSPSTLYFGFILISAYFHKIIHIKICNKNIKIINCVKKNR